MTTRRHSERTDAELVEAKTARPENYPALGVVTPGEEGASGVRVSLDGVAGAQPFVVGNAARGGSYVRRIDEGQSWLSDTDVSVDTDPTDWLDRDIMDIAAADVVSVEIRHPDGEIVSAQRNGVNLQLAQLPEGKVPTGPAAVNPLAGVLSLLRCDDVQSAASFDAADLEPVEAVWTSADGIVVEARLYSRDDARYAAFDVRFEPPPPASDAADADAAESEPGASPAEAAVADKDAATAVESDGARDEAQRIAARTAGWVYRLPTAKYRQMTRRANDFLRLGSARPPLRRSRNGALPVRRATGPARAGSRSAVRRS